MDDPLIAVTGASRGIGAAIAIELAGRGFRVACLTRRGAGPEADSPPELVARFVNHDCDVNDEVSVRQALKAIAAVRRTPRTREQRRHPSRGAEP